MSNIEEIADFAHSLSYSELPQTVVDKAKEIVLHAWGVQLAASTLPWSKQVFRFVRSQGGNAESTVVNYGHRTTAINAAFVNGAFGHGFEMDDNHAATGVKGGCVMVPTALAVGERQLATGKDVITSVVAGYEVETRVALTVRTGLNARGAHPTGGTGAFGAATVASRLLNMSQVQTAHALAAAGAQTSGLNEIPASGRGHLKRTFGGMAAAGGIRSALLAREGLTAPMTTLELNSGFTRLFDVDADTIGQLTAGLRSEWQILNVHYKIYAQDGYIQPISEALSRIRADSRFDADQVEVIRIGTSKYARDEIIGAIREPRDLTDAQFSANFSAALFVVAGGAGFNEYTDENLRSERVRDLSNRVVVEVDEEIDSEHERSRPRGARVTVRLRDGLEITERVDHLRRLTGPELDEKFFGLAQAVLPQNRCEQLAEMAHSLESVRDISLVAPLLTRSPV